MKVKQTSIIDLTTNGYNTSNLSKEPKLKDRNISTNDRNTINLS